MSKQVKQMEMAALTKEFQGVRDFVVMEMSGLTAQADFTLRKNLRKKKIQLKRVKNSLTRRVFGEMGLPVKPETLAGPTVLAWGAGSIAELSQELETALKKNDKVKFKGALADGQEVTFEQALKMPTRAQAIGRVLMLILSPGGRLVGQIIGPGGMVSGAVKSIAEKKPEEEAAAPAPTT